MADNASFREFTSSHETPPLPDLDLNVPTVARTYDALLDGKDNFEADRAAARVLESVNPGTKAVARQNRRFLTRAVQHAADRLGIDQFLDLGSGLPTMENTHQVARRRNPAVRVVYVDLDPIVLTHSRALLVDGPGIAVAEGDLRHVESILSSPEVTRLLDLDRPVCLMLVSLLHCIPDADDPWGTVRRYLDRLAPGSALILSHLVSDDASAGSEFTARVHGLGFPWGRVRMPEEVKRAFDGLDLVSPAADDSAAPMLVDCESWRNANVPPVPRPADTDQKIWEHAGVGVKR